MIQNLSYSDQQEVNELRRELDQICEDVNEVVETVQRVRVSDGSREALDRLEEAAEGGNEIARSALGEETSPTVNTQGATARTESGSPTPEPTGSLAEYNLNHGADDPREVVLVNDPELADEIVSVLNPNSDGDLASANAADAELVRIVDPRNDPIAGVRATPVYVSDDGEQTGSLSNWSERPEKRVVVDNSDQLP